jgi:WD40 repeat protein
VEPSPDGKYLAVLEQVTGQISTYTPPGAPGLPPRPFAGWQMTIWDVKTGKELARFEVGTQQAQPGKMPGPPGGSPVVPEDPPPVQWSPDSKVLACATNTDVLLFAVTTARQWTSQQAHRGKVTALLFTPDGKLVSGSDDGTMLVWNATKVWEK